MLPTVYTLLYVHDQVNSPQLVIYRTQLLMKSCLNCKPWDSKVTIIRSTKISNVETSRHTITCNNDDKI